MPNYKRYAIYYAPPTGDLAEFAASWLGWDPTMGCHVDHPKIDGLSRPISEITATPRKYGFHGTIKPPFALQDGKTVEQLIEAIGNTTSRLNPVTLEGLELSALGRFLALTVTGDHTPLSQLAATVVSELDEFRKAPTEAELERRRAKRLTDRQFEMLEIWGYPFVMDQFKFHMTLTGRMTKSEAKATKDALAPLLKPLLPIPFTIHDLCLFGEAEDGIFHLIKRFELPKLCTNGAQHQFRKL